MLPYLNMLKYNFIFAGIRSRYQTDINPPCLRPRRLAACLLDINGIHSKIKNLRMSEVTLATRSRESAQPIRIQVSFELRTFFSFLTFWNLFESFKGCPMTNQLKSIRKVRNPISETILDRDTSDNSQRFIKLWKRMYLYILLYSCCHVQINRTTIRHETVILPSIFGVGTLHFSTIPLLMCFSK